MSKKHSENLFDRLAYNDKKIIKNYNSLIRSKKRELLFENGMAAVAGLGAISSLITLYYTNPENYLTEEIYEMIRNSIIAAMGAETIMAVGIPLLGHKYHKTLREEITDLKIKKAFLKGEYQTCVCNEEEDIYQKPIFGCELTGDLTEAPQTLIRK